MEAYTALLASCEESGTDPCVVAFVALDTCGSRSPIRGCTPGAHLFHEIIMDSLKIDVVNNPETAKGLRDAVRRDLWGFGGGQMMERSMQKTLSLLKDPRHVMLQRDRYFLHAVCGQDCVGTDVYRDKALNALRVSYTKTGGWQEVQFPIVFHLQWNPELTPTGKPKMLFHVTFEPWKMAVGLALVLCGPCPPIQVRTLPLLLRYGTHWLTLRGGLTDRFERPRTRTRSHCTNSSLRASM